MVTSKSSFWVSTNSPSAIILLTVIREDLRYGGCA